MTTKVKICGINTINAALDAIELGADMLGFNFYPDSKRFVDPELFDSIINEVPFGITKVGVFVNADPSHVINIATDYNLDLLQFHGDETAEYCNQFARPFIRAVRPKKLEDLIGLENYEADYYLVDSFVQDTYGGTGVVSNWDLAREVAKRFGKPIILSGGLTPENVEMAVSAVKPFAVDVASGVEVTPGVKDYRLLEQFIAHAKFTQTC